MPNIFDTFSLGNYFSIDASTRSLTRVANAITSGTPSFDRILLNDEDIRERARVHKEGVDFDRERLSSLIGKVQQLQARLQATYQSMLDRQLSTNSAEVGTNHEVPDTTIFSQNVWKSVGRGALQFSKAAHSDKDVIDTWTDGPNNLGRLSYFRPDAVGNMYQERGGYYTALNYLWGFDLHQLRYTYATGTLGPQPLGTPGVPLGSDQLFEMDAIDFNKMANIVWKLGDVIKLDPAKVFTPEFSLAFPPIKQGDIKYQNGSGYQFTPVTYLYAYVREVDILPDGVTKPRSIDLISGPVPASDANMDGIPDNAIQMNDFLTSILTDDLDLSLRGNEWNGSTAPGVGEAKAASVAVGEGWKPWNGNTAPTLGGSLGAGGIWSDNTTKQVSSFHTTRVNGISGEIDVLKHNALTYKGFATATNDEDGVFFWTQAGAPGGDPGISGGAGNGAAGWTRSGVDGGGATRPGTWDIANGAGIQSQQLQNNKDIKFSYTGLSGYWSGTTASSGQQVTGVLGIKKIAGQATDMRYSVDRFGNIFDKYGQGNTAADHYDYIPKIIDNTKGNYVGNIFGNNTRVGRKVQLDGENNRTATALGSNTVNVLDSTEKKPLLAFASRDYGRPDDLIALASATENPEVSPGVKVDNEIRNVDTFNPQFAEMYLGFSDTTQTTVGFGSGKIDGYGNRMNQIVFLPFRTANSTLADAVVNPLADRVKLMDRDYNVLGVGTKVQIVDNASGVVAGTGNPPISTGTITGLSATGEYTVSHDDPAISLDPQRQYTITTVPDPNARLAGNLENSFVSAIKTILGGNEYKEAIRAGLMEDLMLSASSSDPFGGSLSAKLTLRYNKRQERVELYQNSFAAFYKST